MNFDPSGVSGFLCAQGARFLLHSGILIAAALLLARLFGKSGLARSAIYRATLLAVILAPVVSFSIERVGLSCAVRLPAAQPAAVVMPSDPAPMYASSEAAHAAPPSLPVARPEKASRPMPKPETIIAALWAASACLLTAWLLISHVALWRTRSRSVPVRDLSTLARLKSLCERLRVHVPGLRVSSEIGGPILTGALRPVVIIPEAQKADLLNGTLDRVLMHELAHQARRDCLWNLLARVVCALGCFQPLLWVLARRLEDAGEDAADDRVLALGADARAYARDLASAAEKFVLRRPESAAGLGVIRFRSSLGRRVTHVLDTSRHWVSSLSWRAIAMICTLTVLATVLTAALSFAGPATDAAAPAGETKTGELNASLRQGPGQPASQELISKILKENSLWLRPPLRSLAYTFSMANKDNTWKAKVAYIAPNDVTINLPKGETYSGKVDNGYDPDKTAYPGRLRNIIQGVTFSGPMQSFQAAPQDYAVSMVGEDAVNGRDAMVLQIKFSDHPSEEAIRQRDERLKPAAMRSKYDYQFLPVEQQVGREKRTVIELKCLHEEGPGWKALLAAYHANPAEIKWGGKIITSRIGVIQGETRPVIALNDDPEFTEKSPITSTIFAGGENNLTKKLTLGEGERLLDEALFREVKAKTPWRFPTEVGCGIWGTWYGYSGGGGSAEIDQVWIDKETGGVLREEGFTAKGVCRFVYEYDDWEVLPVGGIAPRHVMVTLPEHVAGRRDWKFDMRFTTLEGKAWLLDHLTDSCGSEGVSATARVSDVSAAAEKPM
jgi:beta-lactamase regulating signal transducer with metallopeptidase domain